MKRYKLLGVFLACALLCGGLPALAPADEVTEMWARLYKQADTLKQKYEIMQNIVEMSNRDIIPLLIDALDELIQQSIYLDRKEKVILNDLKILVVNKLGELRAENAADYIFTVVIEADDPQLKSEALITLGDIGADEYARDIALILKNLSLYRGENVRADEAVAYGCVLALEKMRDPIGYLPVFFTTTAGFSRKIKDAAEKALGTMTDDPSEILAGLVKNESSFDMKLEGLKAENRSKAPPQKKIEVATIALNEGLINKPANMDEAAVLKELRRLAMEMIINIGTSQTETIPLLEKVLYLNNDPSEKTFAIEALRSISGDRAAGALARFLGYQNDRQQSGVSTEDNRVVLATIKALGNVQSRVGYEELLRSKYVGYPAIVGREADRVLKSLGE
jgi:hypothetical protein